MKCPEAEKVQTIFGREANVTAVVGFCHYHRAFMTVAEMKRKRCLQKGCNRMSRVDGHPFWEQRDRKKKRKQLKKEAGIPVYEKVNMRTDHNGEIIGIEEKKGGRR